ncbi:AAA family ATPase [uncultured Ruminococcus sp.]|uniref:AAA family ATPase n=1 Tax=uncultured Ruminococcus sp. TaxID=165186 RepID=UPI0025E93718|nr:AAA family ATPase [uncultured Ruminococcus sp.]
MVKVHVRFNPSWVLRKRSDEMMPVDRLIPVLEKKYSLAVISKDTAELVGSLKLKDGEDCKTAEKDIMTALEEFYGDVNVNCRIEVFEEEDTENEEADRSVRFTAEYEPDGPSRNGGRARVSDTDREEDDDDPKEEIMMMEGAENFKALIMEIEKLSYGIHHLDSIDTFLERSYLFAINEGDGYSYMLTMLSMMLDHHKLGYERNRNFPRKREIRLPPPANGKDSPTPITVLGSIMEKLQDPAGMILSFDITHWINDIASEDLHLFIRVLKDYAYNAVVAFRVPYLEEKAFNKLYLELSRQMFIKPVTVTPLGIDQLRSIAERRLIQKGFRIREEALSIISERLAEELRIGKCYGIKTVDNVVAETILEKAMNYPDDNIIRADEIMNISSSAADREKSGRELIYDLIGIENVRDKLFEMIAAAKVSARASVGDSPCIHMQFVGKPGTGKTTVARILGKLLKENGVLKEGRFFEHSGRDLVGSYIGQTAPKTAQMCRDAYGSVLFIDEAYSLYVKADDTKDFGREALTTLIAEMENHRNDMVVILAGYTDDMEELMKGNAGLRDRIPYKIEFPDYTREQLCKIFLKMASKYFVLRDGFEDAAKAFFDKLTDQYMNAKEFSNARFSRNLYERTVSKAAVRCSITGEELNTLMTEDLISAAADSEFAEAIKPNKKALGFL